jgi:hypothetical protein
VVTTFLDSGVKKMKRATTDTIQNATAVGMLIDEYVNLHEAVGTAVTSSEDGRYFYEHGGQEVDAEGNLLDVWHPEIRVLDRVTGIWRDLGTCGEAIQRDHTIILFDNKLWIFGGDDGGSIAGYTTYYKSLYVFDLVTLTCTQLDDAPVERAGAGAVLNDNEIHFVGGWNSGGPLSGVDWYDTVVGDWHVVTLPPELEEFAPTIYPYVGYQSGWSRPVPSPNMETTLMACVDGRLYAWGVDGPEGDPTEVLKTFPTAQLGWSREEASLPAGVVGGEPVVYQGKVYVANPFCLLDDTYLEPVPLHFYDTVTEVWTTVTASLPPALGVGNIYQFGGAALVGSKIYYWGGEDTTHLWDPYRATSIIVFDIPTLTWDQTVHVAGEPIHGWKGDVIGNTLYQLSDDGYQQSINLTDFTATEITADRDSAFWPIWATAQDGKIYWLEGWSPPV